MRKKKISQDPGTGTSYSFNAKRIINKDGSFNVIKHGLAPSTRNTYQALIRLSWWRFLLLVFAFLFIVNGFFAILYTAIGVQNINATSSNLFQDFLDAYYFSFQTFTTVGYGALHPISKLAGIISAVEAIIGWMCFAIITGILYGRFSKPSALLHYSKNAIVAPYKDGLNSLQFRIANKRNSYLMELEATVLIMQVMRDKDGKGVLKRSFDRLHLERDSILFFPLNWTVVHPIDEDSPFYGKSKEEINAMETEILIMIKGFDDTFSNVVHSRHSYKCNEIVWGAKFDSAYQTQPDGEIMLYFDQLDNTVPADLN